MLLSMYVRKMHTKCVQVRIMSFQTSNPVINCNLKRCNLTRLELHLFKLLEGNMGKCLCFEILYKTDQLFSHTSHQKARVFFFIHLKSKEKFSAISVRPKSKVFEELVYLGQYPLSSD